MFIVYFATLIQPLPLCQVGRKMLRFYLDFTSFSLVANNINICLSTTCLSSLSLSLRRNFHFLYARPCCVFVFPTRVHPGLRRREIKLCDSHTRIKFTNMRVNKEQACRPGACIIKPTYRAEDEEEQQQRQQQHKNKSDIKFAPPSSCAIAGSSAC